MTIYLNATPFFNQGAIFIKNKGAALNAAYLFAIHIFHLDNAE